MTHPGKIIRENYLNPRGWTPTQLSRELGVCHQRITKLCGQRQGLTAEVAIRLSRLFTDTTPEFWMGLQSQFELDKAEGEIPVVAIPKRKKRWIPEHKRKIASTKLTDNRL